jgi:hypothetical protein
LKIDACVVSCATFNGKLVMLVLSAVTSDVFDLAVVTSNGDRESDDVVTSSDQLEVVLANSSFGGCTVKEKFDLFEETRFFCFVCNSSKITHTYK